MTIDKWIDYLLFYRDRVRKEVIVLLGIAGGGILMWVYWRCVLCCDKSFQELLKLRQQKKKTTRKEEEQQMTVTYTKSAPEENLLSGTDDVEKATVAIGQDGKPGRNEEEQETLKNK